MSLGVNWVKWKILEDPTESQFVFENRGKIKAKGKGEMEMWFVSAKAEQ